jgi:hypothetical protein
MRQQRRKTPTRTFQCDDTLWSRVEAIAADRGRELSLDPSKLASSVVRTAVEHYAIWYEEQKTKQAAFDSEFDQANRKPDIESKRVKRDKRDRRK